MRLKTKKTKGFTLVELMVVLVIIGIIIALVVPNTIRAIRVANTKECANNIRALDTAIQMFYTESGDWPTTYPDDLVDYMPDANGDGDVTSDDIPTCPITGANYKFLQDGDGNNSSIDRTDHFDDPGPFPDVHN